MVRKVAIYTRVSTLDQTIDNQLIELRDHCSKMGWEIVKEYADEGLSGTLSREKRPALNSLIKDAYRKRFDSVVCWDISRIGRSMKELVLFLSDMKDKGVGICSVRQGFDTSTSMGEIMFQFVGILSSWEREMIRERTLAGLERAKSEGKTLGRRKVTNDTMTAKILELRTAKKSIREIASEVGVSRGTVSNVLKVA
jgi:DNA invertase Pin-like site-specific DNA recombinase|tara:strand:- start:128 stop:718 length:591 start_codon:yes stop_codon:yes gene_type:complete